MNMRSNPYSRGDNLCVSVDDEFMCVGRNISVEEYEDHYSTGMPPDRYCKYSAFMKGKNCSKDCIYSYARDIGYVICLNGDAMTDELLTRAIEKI